MVRPMAKSMSGAPGGSRSTRDAAASAKSRLGRSPVMRVAARATFRTKTCSGDVGYAGAQPAEDGRGTRIALGVERMAEAVDALAPLKPGGKRGAQVLLRAERGQHRLGPGARPAVLRAFERGEAGNDHGVGRRSRGGHAAGGERRDVQLVVGAQHQHGAHKVGGARSDAPGRARAASSVARATPAPWRRGPAPQDPPAGTPHRLGAGIERRRIAGGGQGQHRLRPGDERRVWVDRPAPRGGGGGRASPSNPPVQMSEATSCERPRARQLDSVVAAVEEPLAVDQRDRRLQHRQPPLQRPRRRFVRRPPLFGAPPQPLDVVAGVAAGARTAGHRLGADAPRLT